MTHRLAFQLARYRPGWLMAAIATWTLSFCLPLITGMLMRMVFDTLTGAVAAPIAVWGLIVLLALVAVADPMLLAAWIWIHTTFETVLEIMVRSNVVDGILESVGTKRSPGQSPSAGALVSHVRDDVPALADLVNEWYRLSGEGIFALIALAVMMRTDPMIALCSFLPLAGIVALIHQLRTRLAAAWGVARETTSQVVSFIGELFGAVQALKVGGAEGHALTRLSALNDARRSAHIRYSFVNNLLDAISNSVVIGSRGLVLILAASAMHQGRFTIGDFALFVTYLDWMLMLPRRIGRLLAQTKQTTVAVDRLATLGLQTAPRQLVAHRPIYLRGGLPPVPWNIKTASDRLDVLEVAHLTYEYPTSNAGIRDLTFAITRGSFTVITGPIGAGKTTLLEVLQGLRPMDHGTIQWNGVLVAEPAAFFVPPRSAYTPQVPRLFSETIRENILLGLPDSHVDIDAAIHMSVFEEDVASFSQGTNTPIGVRGVRLSGGQIQRLAAARMFVRQPELLIVDDCSSALDVETERTLWARMAALNQAGTTCIVVSHRQAVLQRADDILLLDRGAIQARGSLTRLLATSEAMQQWWAHILDAGPGQADRA
jgi:ATP-binding cassette subfamily B protein